MVEENKNRSIDHNSEKAAKCMQRLFSPKAVAIGLTVCYCMSLIPLFVLSRFNYPSADDYTNGNEAYHAWNIGHSILSVLTTAVKRTVNEWFTWRGCFTSSFLSAIPPNIFGEGWYKVTAWLVLGMLTVSVICLFRMIFVSIFNADKWTSLSLAVLTLLISVQCVPGRVEVFYWYSGAINYTFMYGVSLLFYSSMIALALHKGKRKTVRIIVSSILGFLVSGANQMTMLNAAIILFIFILLITYQKKWSEYKPLGIPIGIFYVGFLLAVVSPGNFVRSESAVGMNPVKAILVSLFYCLDLVINEWMTWPVIVTVIAAVPLFWYVLGTTKFDFPYPAAVVLFGYCLVSAMITPPLFALGNIGAGRLQGTIFLMFILVLVLCVGYVTGWARKQYECRTSGSDKTGAKEENRYGVSACLCLIISLLFLIFGIMLTMIPNTRFFTSASAAIDCINGSARAYGEALKVRTVLYRENQGGQVIVEPLKERPELLFFSDITEDEEDWVNRGVARYYDLDTVVLKREE